jgi:hypothetical protein
MPFYFIMSLISGASAHFVHPTNLGEAMAGTVIHETLICNFGVLYTVHIHRCANSDPDDCHPDLIESGDKPTRIQRIREVRGITAAQLRGATLIIAVNNSHTWPDVYGELDAIMRTN